MLPAGPLPTLAALVGQGRQNGKFLRLHLPRRARAVGRLDEDDHKTLQLARALGSEGGLV